MKKIIEFPDCWEEVLPCEWRYLLKLRYMLIIRKGISLDDVKRDWCRFVLKNRGIPVKNNLEYYTLVFDLALSLDWMWTESEDGSQVELTFNSTQNLLPEWTELRGPLNHGNDLTFGEFRTAVTIMNSYVESQDPTQLQALCGILYRRPGERVGKPDFDGQFREEFNQARIGLYAERVRMMPGYIQWGVYAWFAYFCQYLMTEPFIIEGTEICFAPVFRKDDNGSGPRPEQSLGMNGILFSVAESGIFGNADETDRTLLLKVMMKLLDDYQRAKALIPNK